MNRRAKIGAAVVLLLALALLVLRLNPRIPLSQSTILQKSSSKGYYYIAATQLAIGVNPDGPDRTPLIEAIHHNDLRLAENLVSHGADLNRQFASGEPNGPPLAWALMLGRRDIAKMLLRNGANPDYRPMCGSNTALRDANKLGDHELIMLLRSKSVRSSPRK